MHDRGGPQPLIDEASLEQTCVRVIQASDRETYSSPHPGSDEHRLLDSSVITIGWMYMDLERAVAELESMVNLAQDDGLVPGQPGARGAALPIIGTVLRMVYHAARSRRRQIEGRLARLVPALDRYHALLQARAQRRLVLSGPEDQGVLGPAPSGPEPGPVWDVGINAILVQAESDLADVAIHTGFPTRTIISRRTHLAQALSDLLWWHERCLFACRQGKRWLEPLNAEYLLPLWCGAATRDQAARMVTRHLGTGRQGAPAGETAVENCTDQALNAPWRSLSPLLSWLIVRGLYRYGFEERAGQLNDTLLSMVAKGGLWESYDTETGEGQGCEAPASTAALVLDLIKTPFHYDRW